MTACSSSRVREALNKTALRRMAVLRPLKVVIENYPEGKTEELEAVNNPEDASAGTRKIRFSRELWIERDDFMENPPKKFFRLSPGKEVRLRYAYFVTCREVVKDAKGEVVELRCTYDPATQGGNAPPDGRKVQATLHWVSAADAVPAEVRLYDQLFANPDPDAANFAADLNPNSLEVLTGAKLEPALGGGNAGEPVQFERQGYFCRDVELQAGAAGVQPHGRPARHLGEGAGRRRRSQEGVGGLRGGRGTAWRLLDPGEQLVVGRRPVHARSPARSRIPTRAARRAPPRPPRLRRRFRGRAIWQGPGWCARSSGRLRRERASCTKAWSILSADTGSFLR